MNRVHTILTIAAIATVLVGWRLGSQNPIGNQAAGTSPDAVNSQTESPGTGSVPATSPAAQADEESTSVAVDASEQTAKLLEEHGCYVSDQLADSETAEYRDVYTCPPRESEPRAYETWSDEVLASMAFGDHEAAAVLGLRHVTSPDPEKEAFGLSLLYRSVALSGDPEVFHEAIGRRYAYLSINGEPQVHNLKQLFVFNLIGRRLGGEDFDPAPIESRLRSAQIQGDEITHLHEAAGQILHTMAELQSEVTGNTSIAEVIADA